jgi:maltooligosyltrehalose trehalohydrolase
VVRSRRSDGIGLDAQWNDDFHHALHTLLTGESRGYYRDYGRLEHFARAWREGYVYAGQHSPFRQRRFGASSRNVPARRLVVFAQNHDQVGNRMRGERLSVLVSLEKQKLAAAAVLLSPFVPLLFMGEEYGETAPFPYFVSHSDPALVEAVREGRRKEFEAFQWEGEPPDPQGEDTFRSAVPDPAKAETGDHRVLAAFHGELIRLRRGVSSLGRLSKKTMTVDARPEGHLLFVHRWSPADDTVAAFHFGGEPAEFRLALPDGAWSKLLDSADPRWAGPGSRVPSEVAGAGENGVALTLAPFSVIVFHRRNPFSSILDEGPE